MSEVSPAAVKELREKTGAGMMDCRKALVESTGNLEAAVDWLRKKGLSAAAKKSGRIAAEGLIAISVEGTKGAIIELNAETDFVARNDKFQALARTIAEVAVRHSIGDVEELKKAPYPQGGHVSDAITNAIATIGENMTLRRAEILGVTKGFVASYIHGATAPGLGKIGVLVGLESEGDLNKLEALGKQIAMHIAAANPQFFKREEIPSARISIEREAAKLGAEKFVEAFKAFAAQAERYKARMGQKRAFSEKQLHAKLEELAQTLSSVDELLADVERFNASEDRKDKQNAVKTQKILDVFFQEAAYLLEKVQAYGDMGNAVNRYIELKLEQFYEEAVFMEQLFVVDNKTKIEQLVAESNQKIGKPVKLTGFIRLQLGEGVEKKQTDFAAEVAAAANG